MTGTRLRALTAALAIAMSAAACSSDSVAELGMAVSVYTSPGHDPYSSVSFLRLYAQSPSEGIVGDPVVVPYSPTGQAEIPLIPYGADRQIVVEGWTAGAGGSLGFLVSRGKSLYADVLSGVAQQTLPVLLARVNAFVSLSDSINRSVVQLVQGRVGHAIERTPRHELLVVGGGAVANATAAWWGPTGVSSLSKSVEIVDLTTNSVRQHADGMFFERAWHTVTALGTGQALIAGGYANINGTPQAINRVEVYNPGGPIQVLQNNLAKARAGHTATLVDEETFTVLFVGGDTDGQGTYELWNPVSGTLSLRDLPEGARPRGHHRATSFTLPGRKPPILITGGEDDQGMIASVMIYDVQTDTMFLHKESLSEARAQHAAVFVAARNYVYVAGGYTTTDRQTASAAIDVYDIGADDLFANQGFRLKTARGGIAAAAMSGNSVLLSGGTGTGGGALNSIEVIYEYLDPARGAFVIDVAPSNTDPSVGPPIPFLQGARFGQQAIFLDGGMALLIGGVSTEGGLSMPTDLTLYNPQ
jgi:hypothetical protein